MVAIWLKGLVLGFSIAAPVGPIGVLCIKRTLAKGAVHGFISGLGAASADAIYGIIAGFGLTALTNVLVSRQIWLQSIGGAYLCYLGIVTFFSKPALKPAEMKGSGLIGDYLSTLMLTLTNPVTILSFAAIFAGVGIGRIYSPELLVLGIFCGSALWWLALSGLVSRFRSGCDYQRLSWVNRISGIIITGFGVITLQTLIVKLVTAK